MKWVQYWRMDGFALVLARVRASWERAGRPLRVLAAYSGGADSTALLLALRALRDDGDLALRAVHVHHGLRAESDGEEALVREQCQALSVPLVVKHVQVSPRGSVELAAREARYAAFYETLEDGETLALGHHAGDQLETALMRLARGGGATGLSGMREYDGARRLWRPLLPLSGDALRACVRALGVPFCEDESNRDTAYSRNALRHAVVPALKAVYPACEEAAARACALTCDEEDYWRAFTRDFLQAHAQTEPPCPFLLTKPFDALHVAAQRRVLRAFAPVEMEMRHVEEARTAREANLPGGYRTLRTADRLHLLPPVQTPSVGWALREAPFDGDFGDGLRRQAFPRAALIGAELRARRPGDRIRPFGAAGAHSLKQYFIDRKLDRPFRDHCPLLARGSEVLWVVGMGASEEARVRVGDAALLTFDGRLPWDMENTEEKAHDI